jgi:hypothetical protein
LSIREWLSSRAIQGLTLAAWTRKKKAFGQPA